MDLFAKIEKHYIDNNYSYSLISNKNDIIYRELYNGLLINELEFEKEGLYWKVLSLCNKQINSLEKLVQQLNIAKADLISVIDALKNEKLLYSNKDCSEIVTIINAEEIN